MAEALLLACLRHRCLVGGVDERPPDSLMPHRHPPHMRSLLFSAVVLGLVAVGLGACSPSDSPDALSLSSVEIPVEGATFAPRLSVDAEDRLLLSYLADTDAGHALQFIRYDGNDWSTPQTVAEGDDWFANWADTPGVRPVGDWLFAHWLVRSGPGTYHYNIHAAWSNDGGETWGEPFILHGEGRPAEHGFLSSVVLEDGALGVTWLDGRYTVDSEASHENAASHNTHASHQGEMSLRWARFEPGESQPSRDIELDDQVCDCCMTASVREGSDVRVLYRDRSDAEIRDIASVRVTPQDQKSEGRVAVDDWQISACPVEGPAMVRRGTTTDAVWFTRHENEPRVFWASTISTGDAFSDPVRMDEGQAVGRVGAVAVDEERTLVTWLENAEGDHSADGTLMARVVNDEGAMPSESLMPISTSRSSGFPLLERTSGAVWVAWTDATKEDRHVRVGTIQGL